MADLSLYEFLRRKLTERDLPLGLIPLWAILNSVSDFLRLSADEYIQDSDQKQWAKEKAGLSYSEIEGGVSGTSIQLYCSVQCTLMEKICEN